MNSPHAHPRILIVRLSAMGDVIHTLPCLDRLRRAFPQAYIGWVCEELSRELLDGHPQIDEVFVIPKRRWRGHTLRYLFPEIIPFYRRIRSRRFDTAIDFQGLTKSGLVTRLSGARRRVGYGGVDCRELNRWFTNHKVDPGEGVIHILDRNLSLLSAVTDCDAPYERILPQRREWVDYVDGWLVEINLPVDQRFVAINPGAGWETKRWAPERFAELGRRINETLNRPVLVTWGPGEEALAESICKILDEANAEAYMAPPTTVGQSIEVTRRCDLFIAGDTGPIHLAAALDVPVIALFAASDGQRNHPGGRRQIIIETDLTCRPCWKRKFTADCDRACLEISVDDVFQAACELIDADQPVPQG